MSVDVVLSVTFACIIRMVYGRFTKKKKLQYSRRHGGTQKLYNTVLDARARTRHQHKRTQLTCARSPSKQATGFEASSELCQNAVGYVFFFVGLVVHCALDPRHGPYNVLYLR